MRFSIFIFLFLVLHLSSCKVYRFLAYNVADYDDYKKFKSQPLKASTDIFQFPISEKDFSPIKFQWDFSDGTPLRRSLDRLIEESNTLAFLIIQQDSIRYQKYPQGRSPKNWVNLFSSSKSILSLLLGCAIDDGYIQSEDELIRDYLPELAEQGFQDIKIKNLLQMTSGIDFYENYYSPYADAAKIYYTSDLRREISKLKIAYPPNTKYNYSSGDSQILGMVLTAALKGESITSYLQRKIWQPLGMQYDGSWTTDDRGLEKSFCCINTTALDLAKIGRLYMKNGNWNGQQIISSQWIKKTRSIDTSDASKWYYQYNWYLNRDESFYTQGYKGQHLYVDPQHELIIVRLGKNQGKVKEGSHKENIGWNHIFQSISQSIESLD